LRVSVAMQQQQLLLLQLLQQQQQVTVTQRGIVRGGQGSRGKQASLRMRERQVIGSYRMRQ